MAGLDPAIHLLRKRLSAKKMDTRVKPAYDAFGSGLLQELLAMTIDRPLFNERTSP
jgi:hypothetical protein